MGRLIINDERDRRWYGLRMSGVSCAEIAATFGVSESTVSSAVGRYTKRHSLDLPPTVGTYGAEAYSLRAKGMKWRDIAAAVVTSSGASAHTCARHYAVTNGLQWPPCQETTFQVRHRRAYEARAEGVKWCDIADRYGYGSEGGAFRAARRYAKRNSLSWPPSAT